MTVFYGFYGCIYKSDKKGIYLDFNWNYFSILIISYVKNSGTFNVQGYEASALA